jgi:hypothetical protein
MTDDLVKRLRRADTCIFPTERERCHCGEAADRILRLEAALQKVLARCSWYEIALYNDVEEIIRKALEGKDD